MPRDFTTRKRVLLGALIFLTAADIALAAYRWQLASAPFAPEGEFTSRERLLKRLHAEIERAQKIRDETPKTQKDCEEFEKSLLPAGTGYSSVSAELGKIEKQSGVRLEDLAFKPTPIPNRSMTEVALDATIEGNYKNVILFLNAIQRSSNIYEVESLTLATNSTSQAPSNVVKVGLHLKTYFRTAP